jgi:hypothetical protein
MRIRTLLRFLTMYSAMVTVAFLGTVYFGLLRTVRSDTKAAEFDRIRVHRIDFVEPDGTPRLIVSNRAAFPGEYFHGREVARESRDDSAGMLFINDEGTEDGGLIYGGAKKDGKPYSFSHLSFDQYDQDQTVVVGTALDDGQKTAGISLNDMPEQPITPAMAEDAERIKKMPHGQARADAWAAFLKTYPAGQERAALRRSADGTVGLVLKDQQGRKRLELRVDENGNPSIALLDEQGKVRRDIRMTQ